MLTIEYNLKICELVSDKCSLASVATEFGVGKKTVHDIVKSKHKLQTFHSEIRDIEGLKKRKIVRRADFEQLDKADLLVSATKMQRLDILL